MTDTPTDQMADQPPEPALESGPDPEPQEPAGPANCRHCGQPFDGDATDPDWLCPSCEHHQDLMQCPTCGSQVRISAMPAEMVPEIHSPARRKKEQ